MHITVEPAESGGYLLRCECGWERTYKKHAVGPETLVAAAQNHRYESHMFEYSRTNWKGNT